MALPIEDYALLGDCRGAALVGLDGSIDWACIPRFDAEACFAALLGSEENGFWKIAPTSPITSVKRAYRDGTLTIETEMTCEQGKVIVTDFMPVAGDGPGLVARALLGFLPATDPRIVHTVMDIERRLFSDGFVARYLTKPHVDGLPVGEGAFLPCSFWYVDALKLLGRHEEARAHFDRLMALVNDVGLLAEEYDPVAKRMLGNFPQALSHVALVHSAVNLSTL